MKKKSQSAMEYLMTYGWAILIILIAVGALFYLGVFSPSTPSTCFIQAPFICSDMVLEENFIGYLISGKNVESMEVTDIIINGESCLNDLGGDLVNYNLGDKNLIGCIANINSLETEKISSEIEIGYISTSSDLEHNIVGQGTGSIEETIDGDGDGLSNNLEGAIGTDILLEDTDGDDVGDGFEFIHGSDPLDGGSVPFIGGSDGDGDGALETLREIAPEEWRWQEIAIVDQHSYYTYNGHASHYLWWNMYIEQEIWWVDAEDSELIEQITSPDNNGVTDFKLIKCINDGEYIGCVPDVSKACDSVVKNYGEMNPAQSTWKYYCDDPVHSSWQSWCDSSGHNCDGTSSAIRTIRLRDPYNSGNKLRLEFYQLQLSDYGKHQICVKYNKDGIVSNETCMEFISDWIDMDSSSIIRNHNFGDNLEFSTTTQRTRYDQKSVLNNYLEKRCSLHSWSWWHDPRSDNGPSVTIRRHRTWDNYWGYIGIFFGISSSQPSGDHLITTTFTVPSTCKIRDRDGSGDYAVYHHNCDWYHLANEYNTICCEDRGNGLKWYPILTHEDPSNGECITPTGDQFEFSGILGGSVTIKNHVDASGDNYDDIRVYIECPNGETNAFGNINDPYTIVSDSEYFWVNDMDYSEENPKVFSEALPDSNYESDTNDYSCNLELNLCGKAYSYQELYDYYEIYGNKYTSPNHVCVSGTECPHANC